MQQLNFRPAAIDYEECSFDDDCPLGQICKDGLCTKGGGGKGFDQLILLQIAMPTFVDILEVYI